MISTKESMKDERKTPKARPTSCYSKNFPCIIYIILHKSEFSPVYETKMFLQHKVERNIVPLYLFLQFLLYPSSKFYSYFNKNDMKSFHLDRETWIILDSLNIWIKLSGSNCLDQIVWIKLSESNYLDQII